MADLTDLSGNRIVLDHTYRVGEAVHRGPMATLYAALWDPFDRPVYIRSYESLIKLRLRHRDTTRIKRAVHDDSGRLRGPALPDVIDVGEEDATRPFLIMRLPEGDLLLRRLTLDGSLEVSEMLRVVECVADALETCRAAGLPHRGPTANRVWLADDGQAILLGAGEVLYRDDTISMSGLATTELIWHIPPESFQRSTSADGRQQELVDSPSGSFRIKPDGKLQGHEAEDDPRAEVYALACLAYQCLNAHHPFFVHVGDPSEGILSTLKDSPLELKGVAKDSALRTIIMRGLDRDPEARPQTPAAFAALLREASGIADAPTLRATGARATVPTAEHATVADGAAAEPAPNFDRALLASVRLWRFATAVLFLGLIGYAVFDYLRPNTIMITSEPAGIELAEVVGHASEPRGTTPIVLRDRNLQTPIELRAVAPNGDMGPPQTFLPREFTDLGRCRRISVELDFGEQ